jgi:hypothetical protein
VKRSVFLIVLVFGAVLAGSAAAFDRLTVVVMALAMVIVTVFGLAPVLFGILTRRAEQEGGDAGPIEVIRLDGPARSGQLNHGPGTPPGAGGVERPTGVL